MKDLKRKPKRKKPKYRDIEEIDPKPCPVCNQNPMIFSLPDHVHYVQCTDCHFRLPDTQVNMYQAVIAWNDYP